MPQASAFKSADSDRAELETVLAALARNPRLAKFLDYICDRYFDGRTDEITEYNIATEVFGRSKTSFDASRDSIARVEAYRLRKKLKEFYESDGKEHEIQISVPPGTYVPVFSRHAVTVTSMAAPAPCPSFAEPRRSTSTQRAMPESQSDSTGAIAKTTAKPGWPGFRRPTMVYSLSATTVLLLLAIGLIRFHPPIQASDHAQGGASQPIRVNQPLPQSVAQVPLRLLAGYDGSPKIDSTGAYWQADRYFRGGAAFRRPETPVAKTSEPMLFDYWRTGDFAYDIPLAPGPYELHLFFVASPPEDFKTAFFHVLVNGQFLLKSFNIGADALGVNVADERVFKDIYPDKDGFLHLAFATERSSPSLNALEILPGLPHRQLPVRLVMQRVALTDHSGNMWHPDNYFQNGTASDIPRQVSGTPDPALYAQERYGHFAYSIPVDTRGRYTLILHFAELYWSANASGSVGAGSRIFRVFCNGSTLLDNFDIFKEAGRMHPLTKTFYHLRASPEGKLDLTFDPIENYATVSAMEVIDESE